MKHLFIPYELALIAKQKGFDKPCFTAWISDNKTIILDNDLLYHNWNRRGGISAPLYQQVIDWLRDEKNIQIIELPKCKTEKGYFQFSIYRIKGDTGKFENDKIRIEALNKAIEQAFTLLP